MRRHHVVNLVLGFVLLGTLGLNWYMRLPSTSRNVEFAPNMVRSPSFSAFESNPHFSDGMAMRLPVPGTIPRGDPPLAYGPGARESTRAGNELSNPLDASDEASRARGAVVYQRYCEVCHGADGTGGGPVVKRGFPEPPSLLRRRTVAMKDGQIFHIVTYGWSRMPGHGAQIASSDRWKVVLHVRGLQESGAAAEVTGGAAE